MDALDCFGVDIQDVKEPWFPEIRAVAPTVYKLARQGLIGVVTIPTAGANYTDAKTVAGVQQALVKKGYDCGDSGPNHDGVDGLFGPKTKRAIQKMQTDVGLDPSGKIDEGVIATLKVTPGVLPPGVSLQDQAALQAQVALDAANAADHANTPADVQAAAAAVNQAGDAASPPLPPDVLQAARDALKRAKAAKTPADVKAAADAVKKSADQVHSLVKPSWWKEPAWPGGWERWKVASAGGGGTAALVALLWVVLR